MKNNHYIVFTIVVIILFASCKNEAYKTKQDSRNQLATELRFEESIYSQIGNLTKGSIFIKCQKVRNDLDKASYKASAIFFDNNLDNRIDNGSIFINNVVLNANPLNHNLYSSKLTPIQIKDWIEGMFGTQVNYTFRLEEGSNNITHTVYIPNRIDFINAKISNDGVERFLREDGILIDWNADKNNQYGVLIEVTWNGVLFDDEHNRKQTDQRIVESYIVPDNGSFLINQNHLTAFPKFAFLKVLIKRGNLATLQDSNDKDYKLFGYSSDYDYFVVK